VLSVAVVSVFWY